MLVTFGVMYLTYTPNSWILHLVPTWSFRVGFFVLGIVHVTQYLAIVWRYNRSLAAKPNRARAGIFSRLHRRGGWLVAGIYIIFCLLYGEFVTGVHGSRWLSELLLAVGFTSTLMHYYYDGFIWKVRHQQNRENLSMTDGSSPVGDQQPSSAVISWWASISALTAQTVFFRQLLYFGIPMTLLTVGAWW